MKGAFIVSQSQDLFEHVERVLVEAGALPASGRVVQLVDAQQRYFTVFERLDPRTVRDELEIPSAIRGTGVVPDLSTASSCWVECRWEEMFTHWVQVIATHLEDSLWVLDDDGVLWASQALVPDEIRL
ncbi:hypothetical protein Cch01nite_32230 [Cellulomonas chitinilytica]|uniref:Uncharacterized protein n=1 Tax=Cellulomonas chitinilytica TaxID=398759 RepID=A0A919P7R6_9CELL|nr:hypothetical protein [Cellulomonas chitinilytica]GIG22499.1 hypothetical protein Cch01nite_32230 [Cellulomonas chitinilytica]